jgi:O-antigen/teichoic acid export membrane protein
MTISRANIYWTSFAQVGVVILQFISTVFISRILGPRSVGVFAVSLSLIAIFNIAQLSGLNNLLIREKEYSDELVGTVFTINIICAAFASIVLLAISGHPFAIISDHNTSTAVTALSVIPLINSFTLLQQAQLERKGEFGILSVIKLASAATSACVAIGLAVAKFDYMSMVYAAIAAAFVQLVSYLAYNRRAFPKPSLARWSYVSKFGLQMMTIGGLSRLAARFSELLMGTVLGLAALGLFSRGSNLYAILWDNVNMAAGRVIFSDFSNIERTQSGLRDPYLRTVEMMTGLLWPAFFGLAIVARPVVYLIYGPQWILSADILSILCVSGAVLTSAAMTWEVYVVKHETHRQTKIEIFRSLTSLAMFAGGCMIGLNAAAGSRILDSGLAVALYGPDMRRLTDTTTAEMLHIYLKSGVITVLAIAPSAIVMLVYRGSSQVPLTFIAFTVLVGIAAWFIGSIVIKHQVRGIVRRLG